MAIGEKGAASLTAHVDNPVMVKQESGFPGGLPLFAADDQRLGGEALDLDLQLADLRHRLLLRSWRSRRESNPLPVALEATALPSGPESVCTRYFNPSGIGKPNASRPITSMSSHACIAVSSRRPPLSARSMIASSACRSLPI